MMYDMILKFWFEELTPDDWWKKDDNLDQLIKDRFSDLHTQAISGELSSYRNEPEGRLAEVIIIDQFSRNIFRDTPQAFLYDPMALILAQTAIQMKADQKLAPIQKSFLYMPFMHSESKIIHEQALKLFQQPGLEFNLDFEIKHKEIIDRFGRYPHRNSILKRISTKEELEFLKEPGSSF